MNHADSGKMLELMKTGLAMKLAELGGFETKLASTQTTGGFANPIVNSRISGCQMGWCVKSMGSVEGIDVRLLRAGLHYGGEGLR